MLRQQANEGVPWTHTFKIATADLSQSEFAVQLPSLLEAYGVDGRKKGSVGSFPGFRGLGINEAYANAGPVIVGPGVGHVTAGLAAWWHWPLILRRYGSPTKEVKFFKHIEFKKSAMSAQLVSGFVLMIPYEGPCLGDTGLQYDDGLPLSTIRGNYVVALLYWDDEPLPHPNPAGWVPAPDPLDPGWRIRILNKTTYTDGDPGGHDATNCGGSTNMDVAAWGQFGYIVNPDVCATGKSYWGTPEGLSAWSVPDGGQGPQALYYDDVNKYVRLRPMGSELAGFSAVPHAAYHDDGDTHGYYYVEVAEDEFRFFATLLDSATGRRTQITSDAVSTGFTGHLNEYYYGGESVLIPTRAWGEGYDTLELWRSPLNYPGMSFKEQEFALPATCPVYDAGLDGLDPYVRRYAAVYACRTATPDTIPAGRTDFMSPGVDDTGLVIQEQWSGYYCYDQPPPADSSRIVSDDDMTVVVAAKGNNAEDATVLVSRAVVPPKLRWSSPAIPRPEDYSATANLWTPDEKVGMVCGMARAGGFTFVVGTRGTLVGRRTADRMVFQHLGEELAPVSRFAWCVGDGCLLILTKTGLYVVSGLDASVQEVEGVSRLLSDDLAWGQELTLDVASVEPAIGLEYDESGGCLIIRNLNRLEAVCFWPKTGAITGLLDFAWSKSTSGMMTTASKSGSTWYPSGQLRQAFFIGELDVAAHVDGEDNNPVNWPAYLDIFYADFGRNSVGTVDGGYVRGPTMTAHGLATALEGAPAEIQDTWDGSILRGSIVSLTSVGMTHKMTRLNATMPIVLPAGGKTVPKMLRRFTGAIVHLWSADGVTLHARRMLFWFAGVGTTAQYYLWPDIPSAMKTILAGGFFAVAPVVFRVKLPLLPSDDGEAAGTRKTVAAVSMVSDFPLVRRYFCTAPQDDPQVDYTDASGTRMWAFGDSAIEGPLSSTTVDVGPSYGNQCIRGEAVSLEIAIGQSYPVPTGRLREAIRAVLTPSRLEQECVVALPFGGHNITVGIEAYLCGAVYELRAMRVQGTILPSPRKST